MSNTWQSVETALFPIVSSINQYLSNYILVFLLLSVGIWYSIKTRFIQIRCFGEGMKKVFGNLSLNGKKHEQGMSSFQALATAIAAQVGTGNIVGASGAILTGGPGAIFWMWLIAFFGMATIYAEAVLAVDTRVIKEDGTVHGGPVYYITKAFSGGFGRFLAGFFAVAIILALGFMGCMVQSNSIGSTFQTAFGVPSWIIGIILVVICGFIFLGGVKRLAAVTEKLVPTMAGLCLLGALLVLIIRFRHIPETFGMIFRYAFQPQAIIGGGFGAAIKTAISQGAKRGLFSNEAGMGSTRPCLSQRGDPTRAGHCSHGRRFHRHLHCFNTQCPGHHLHPLHWRRHSGKWLHRRNHRRDRQDQPGTDCLWHRIRQRSRSYVRSGLPVLLRLLHRIKLEHVWQDQHHLSLRQKIYRSLYRHRPGIHFLRNRQQQ